jgi:hypothetical protein
MPAGSGVRADHDRADGSARGAAVYCQLPLQARFRCASHAGAPYRRCLLHSRLISDLARFTRSSHFLFCSMAPCASRPRCIPTPSTNLRFRQFFFVRESGTARRLCMLLNGSLPTGELGTWRTGYVAVDPRSLGCGNGVGHCGPASPAPAMTDSFPSPH